MPIAGNVAHILADLYTLESEIKDNMTYHGANYVVVRLVAIFERLLKILAIYSMDVSDNSRVEVDVTTLRTILELHTKPADIIKHIMAEIGSYQNINAVENYFKRYKLMGKTKFILTDKEKKNLDKLFKLRHRLTHTVDRIEIKTDHLHIFYKAISDLSTRLIRAYTLISEPFAKASAYQYLGMGALAKKYFKKTIELHKSRLPRNTHDIIEYCNACYQVGELEQALYALNTIVKALDRPDSDIRNDKLAMFYGIRGAILADLKHYTDATQSLDRGLEITPDDPTLLLQMTKVQLEFGNIEQALECALRTLSTPNVPPTLRYWLSEVYAALGNDRIAKILRKSFYDELSKVVEKHSGMSLYMPEP